MNLRLFRLIGAGHLRVMPSTPMTPAALGQEGQSTLPGQSTGDGTEVSPVLSDAAGRSRSSFHSGAPSQEGLFWFWNLHVE